MTAPTGSIATALDHARSLLGAQPALALRQAEEILLVLPRHAPALLLAGKAQRLLGEAGAATASFRAAVAADPALAEAWRGLGDQLHLEGDQEGGNAAHLAALRASVSDPALVEAADALARNDLSTAERLLRERLKRMPTDIGAIRMLAELAGRIGRYRDAETLLARALELAPDFAAARHNLAIAIHRQGRSADAVVEIDRLLADEPGHPSYLNLKAAALGRLGEYAAAIALYQTVLARYPQQPKVWMSLGHALKTVGRVGDSIAAYRKALALLPTLGEAWWSLGNLKTYRFTGQEMTAMRDAALSTALAEEDRFHLEFALGKAEEDAAAYDRAFTHYAEANRRRRALIAHDPDEVSRQVARIEATCTADFYAARAGWGCPASDPIFVVSLPRSGSTLIEQILASHSQVEGTMELSDMAAIATRAALKGMEALTREEVRALGELYLERTRIQRKTDRPRFVDKMPNNWAHVGLIRLILPNAIVIDARRHPMSCCFSNYKQHFARGQGFAYDLEELGRYYRDCAAAMRHIDGVLPGYVHRIFYEAMVDDTEREVRALLAHAGLAFEPACLRFHETERAVRTASSEQVRQPIFRDGLDQWQHFAPWLDPLRIALGPALADYPSRERDNFAIV